MNQHAYVAQLTVDFFFPWEILCSNYLSFVIKEKKNAYIYSESRFKVSFQRQTRSHPSTTMSA